MSVIMRFGQGYGHYDHTFRPNRGSPAAIPLQTRIRAAVRRCIADEIQRLVDMLDEYDGDPDFEIPDDDEPSLGLPNPAGENCVLFNSDELPDAGPMDDDRELDEADGRLEDAGDERDPALIEVDCFQDLSLQAGLSDGDDSS